MSSLSRSGELRRAESLSRPVPVLLVIDKLHRAGAQRNLSQLALGLDATRFQPRVVCLSDGGGFAEDLREAGLHVRALGISRIYGPRALVGLLALARRIRSERIRIVHTYLPSANVFGGAAARLAGVRTLVTTRRDLGFSRTRRLGFVEQRFINPHVTCVVTPCEAVARVVRGEHGLRSDKVAVVPNGVDTRHWSPERFRGESERARLGIPPTARVVGVIANFLRVKGHADFLAAARQLAGRETESETETYFVLAGDGVLRGELEALSRELGLSGRVVFAGPVADTRALLEMFDVLVLPSHSEGMSNVLLEAMSMARPIVATNVGGNPELVVHGTSGVLVPPQDPEALATAIAELCTDRDRAVTLGRNARRRVEARFAIEIMVERYQKLYEEILEA